MPEQVLQVLMWAVQFDIDVESPILPVRSYYGLTDPRIVPFTVSHGRPGEGG